MKPYTTSQRLRQLMTARNLRQVDILRAAEPYCVKYNVKLGKNDLSQYVSGKVEPGQDKLTVLGFALNVSETWLMGYDVPMDRLQPTPDPIPPGFQPMPDMVQVPLVGRIACGEPITAEENIEEIISIPADWHADFSLKCIGDSMLPRIHDGDIVGIRKQPCVENGEIAAVRIDGEATLKRVYLYPDRMVLQPENQAFAPIMLIGEEMNTVKIEGKAVGLCRKL